jgi:hypothetical protein
MVDPSQSRTVLLALGSLSLRMIVTGAPRVRAGPISVPGRSPSLVSVHIAYLLNAVMETTDE